jgi:hypothetical protein
MVVDWYHSRDYHFLALSDHNILSDHEKWVGNDMVIARGGRTALAEYRQRYGEDWVETRQEDGKLQVRLRGLEEFRGRFEEPEKFLLIQAEEISNFWEDIPVHINASNLAEVIGPQEGESVREVIANTLDAVQEQSQRLNRPILAHLNHPNYRAAVTAEDLAAVLQERFFEVYNGHPAVFNQGRGGTASTERIWDIANTIRLKDGAGDPLFGLATDDSHNFHNASGSTPGHGWIMVRAPALSAAALIAAMEAGDFYASSGVVLEDVAFRDGELSLSIKPVEGASYVTKFIGTEADADLASEPFLDKEGKELRTTRVYSPEIGKVLATVEGVNPSFELGADLLYVRAVVTSSEEMDLPVKKGDRKMAWTQPVGWRD